MHIPFLKGLGEYKLTEEFSSADIPSDEVHLIPALTMDDIVKSVREGIDIHVHSEDSDITM